MSKLKKIENKNKKETKYVSYKISKNDVVAYTDSSILVNFEEFGKQGVWFSNKFAHTSMYVNFINLSISPDFEYSIVEDISNKDSKDTFKTTGQSILENLNVK